MFFKWLLHSSKVVLHWFNYTNYTYKKLCFLTLSLLCISIIVIQAVCGILSFPDNQQGFNLVMLAIFPKLPKFTYKISPSIHFIPRIFFSITIIQMHTEIFPKEMDQDHNLPKRPWHK